MAQFWKASSVTVNNGSKIVTVNTGDDVANIITNSMLQISNFQYVEVKTVNTVNQTIELFFPWDKGNVSAQPAIAAPNRAAIKEAVEELRALRQTYEGLASDVSVAASANSIPRRDASGRIKTATPSANEDAVNKGFLGTAAQKDVGTSAGNVMEVGAFGIGGLAPTVTDANVELESGIYSGAGAGGINFPVNMRYGVFFNAVRANNNAVNGRLYVGDVSDVASAFIGFSNDNGQTFNNQELYHSGNTNFDEFGGESINDVVAQGAALNNNYVIFYLPINSKTAPTGITVNGFFKVRTPVNNSMVKGSVTPIIFGGLSSNKVACIGFDSLGATGLSQGDVLELVTESNTSKITVNF